MRRWIVGAVFAALWMGWALLIGLVSILGGPLARLFGALPRVPGVFYGWALGPALVAGVLTALLVALSYIVLGRMLSKAERPSFARAWLAAILAAAVVGLALDLPSVIRGVGMFGIRGILNEPYNMQHAVFWALFAGWIPGLVVSRGRAPALTRALAPTERRSPAAWLLPVSAGVVFVALVGVGVWGIEVSNEQSRQAAAEHEAAQRDAFGALPDPAAPGDPVPIRAAGTEAVPADACTSENATVLLGGADAALGRRMQVVELLNFSEQPCAVEGYPDIAFGDQNAHLLDVTIEHAGTSMGEGPGAVLITVPAGGSVKTVIAWGANSTNGAIVAHSLHAAIRPGEDRGSWPVELDIVTGSTVSVTAWRSAALSTE